MTLPRSHNPLVDWTLQGGLILLAIALALAPWWSSAGMLRVLGECWVYVALATLWNLLAGYGGLISVGQQAFVGIGGYALFSLTVLAEVPPLPALALTALVGGLIAIPIGTLALRLRGAYFAIGSWAIAEVLRLGIMQVPAVGGGSGSSLPTSVLRLLAETRATRMTVIYSLSMLIGFSCILFAFVLLRSRWGLALRALRDSEMAADSLGISVTLIKMTLFCVIGMLTSLVGGLVVLQKLRVSPDAQFAVNDWTAFVIFMVVVGGYGTLEGPIVGTAIFFVMRETLSELGTLYQIILGSIAVVTMLKAPRGLWGIGGWSILPIRNQPPAPPTTASLKNLSTTQAERDRAS